MLNMLRASEDTQDDSELHHIRVESRTIELHLQIDTIQRESRGAQTRDLTTCAMVFGSSQS